MQIALSLIMKTKKTGIKPVFSVYVFFVLLVLLTQ